MVEKAIPIGNFEDKYETANPIARRLVNGFLTAFDDLASRVRPRSIHEIGCGEGKLTERLAATGAADIRGSDLEASVFAEARLRLPSDRFRFQAKSLYDMTRRADGADFIVCCEVLEHVEDPSRALDILHALGAETYLFSVPREPIWRVLNVARGKYWRDFGNTPGHLNHWSRDGFLRFLSRRFDVIETRAPLPWTMALCRPKPGAP